MERISLSSHRDNFILKGGMLVTSIVGIDTRSTMDMDATIRGIEFSEEKLREGLETILASQINDDVIMTINGYDRIRDDSEYPGIRVSIETVLDKTRQIIKVDFTTGDVITPEAMEYSYKLMLEDRSINILAYNLETVLAEKLETILTRGTVNSRMRDYYDVHILTTLRSDQIDWNIFPEAFKNTTKKRKSYTRISERGNENMKDIVESNELFEMWNRYSQKNDYVLDLSWDVVLTSTKALFNKSF